MALLDNLKTLWHGAKNIVSGWFDWDEETSTQTQPQTLNEQIQTWTINNTTNINNTARNDTLTSSFANQSLSDVASQSERDRAQDYSPDVPQQWFLNLEETELTQKMDKVLEKEREKENENFFDTLNRWGSYAEKFINKTIDSYRANAEAQEQEKHVALGYNPNNHNVLFLDFWNIWGEEQMFQNEWLKYNNIASNPAATQQEVNQALWNFYTNTRWLFRLRSDDYYNDWFLWKIRRREDQYTQGELDLLAQNNTKKWRYPPEFNEWLTFVNARWENQSNAQQIYASYWLDQEDEDTVNLSSSAQSEYISAFMSSSLDWVNDISEQYIDDWQVQADFMAAWWNAARDQATRIYPIVSRIYAYEKIIRTKPITEWTDDEAYLVDTAERFRQMERAAARWINNYLKQSAKNVDENWQISETLDSFEWWQSLWDVLSWEVKRLSWEESWWRSWDSTIDVFQQMANEALYRYERWRGSTIWNVWEWAQHLWEGFWYRLWEFWQQATMLVWNLWTLVYHMYTPRNRDELWQEASGERSLWSTSAYLDQDFTVWRLIETDKSTSGRTIEKYWLRWLEYVPEVLGNVVPDIALWFATWGAWAVWALTKTKRAYQALKAAEWMSMFQRLNQAVKYWTWWVVKWIDWLLAASKATSKISPTRRAIWELVDWTITQSIIDQAMDAQWSAYDTEAYSTQSFVLSSLGTLWFNVIMPLFTDAQIVQWIRKLVNKDAIGVWWVWDVLEYMSSSNEARDNVIRLLQKADSNISVRDLKELSRNFSKVQEVAKQAYNSLPPDKQADAGKWTKQLMQQYINQFYRQDTDIARQMNRLIQNELTNPADIIKYLWKIPWQVSFWPYVSKIKLKSWTDATVVWEAWSDKIKKQLNTIDWGIAAKVEWWFSPDDIANLKKIEGFSDVADDVKWEYFTEVDEHWKKHLTEKWLEKLWMKAENIDLFTLWIEISEAENAREALNKLKTITTPKKKIKEATVDAVVDSWAYGNVVNKIKEIVC